MTDVLATAMLPYCHAGGRGFQYGGAIVNETLLARLAARGHRVRAIQECPAPPRGAEPVALEGVEVAPFALEFYPGHLPPSEAVLDRQRARLRSALGAALAEGPPDVVLIGRDAQAWYVPEVVADAGLPSVLVAHGVPTGGFEAGLYPPDAERELIARMRRADAVVAVAHHLEPVLRERGVQDVVVIENAVDATTFRPGRGDRGRFGAPDEGPVVGHVCGVLSGKRPEDLVASAAIVAATEPAVRYLVTGTGDGLEETQALADRHGIGHVFRWLGDVPHADMPALYRGLDVMVHTSEREGGPLTYREAQACEVPVVATAIAPAREAIENGRTGVLYPLGDAQALAAETLALLRDPARAAAIGRAGREAVLGHDVDAWADEYAAVLAGVAARAA